MLENSSSDWGKKHLTNDSWQSITAVGLLFALVQILMEVKISRVGVSGASCSRHDMKCWINLLSTNSLTRTWLFVMMLSRIWLAPIFQLIWDNNEARNPTPLLCPEKISSPPIIKSLLL